MKYLGEKSLSSFLSWFFHVGWYVVLVCAVIAGIFGSYFFYAPLDDPTFVKIAKYTEFNLQDKDWVAFRSLPLAVRLLLLPYFIAVIVLLLKLIKKAQQLFTNFKKDIVFNKSNVLIISTFSKLLIPYSILTFNFSSLIASLLLLLLCEIFKNGTVLQEEHDFTV
jgi:hypothetical protein